MNKFKLEIIRKSKSLKVCKVVAFILILGSVGSFYFERVSILEKDKNWRIDLIEKGENVYKNETIVWKNLSGTQQKSYELTIKKDENRIKYNSYLIAEHIIFLILNIILFISLFSLNNWVKYFLLIWLLCEIFFSSIFYTVIGYETYFIEQLSSISFGLEIGSIIFSLLVYVFYFYMGRQLFKLIYIKSRA